METFEYPTKGRITLEQHQELVRQHNNQVREQREVVKDLQVTIREQSRELEAFRSRQSRLEQSFHEMFSEVVRNIVIDTFKNDILPNMNISNDWEYRAYQSTLESIESTIGFDDPRI